MAATDVQTPVGFDKYDYLQVMFAQMEQQASDEGLTGKDRTTWIKEQKDYLTNLVKSTSDSTLLPSWSAARKIWVLSNGEIKVPNKIIRVPDGGYYDFNGNQISPDIAAYEMGNYMQVESTEMTDYEKSRLAFDINEAKREQKQWENEFLLREQQLGQSQAESSWQRQYQQTQLGLESQRLGLEQRTAQTPQERLELARLEALSQVQTPRGWIRQWMLENPWSPSRSETGYAPEILSMQGTKQQIAQTEGALYDAAESGDRERVKNLTNILVDLNKVAAQKEKMWRPLIKEAQQQAEFLQKSGGYPGSRPKMPAIPEELYPLTGEMKYVPEERQEFITPSAQTLAKTPYDVRQKYAGLLDWAGKRSYEDVLDYMQSMLPSEPRGLTSPRWAPARQRF